MLLASRLFIAESSSYEIVFLNLKNKNLNFKTVEYPARKVAQNKHDPSPVMGCITEPCLADDSPVNVSRNKFRRSQLHTRDFQVGGHRCIGWTGFDERDINS